MTAQRYQTREMASVEVFGQTVTFSASVKNLSQTGACLEWGASDVNLKKGDLLRLTVDLSRVQKTHNLNAEVVWSNDGQIGVQFIRSDELIDKMIGRNG